MVVGLVCEYAWCRVVPCARLDEQVYALLEAGQVDWAAAMHH